MKLNKKKSLGIKGGIPYFEDEYGTIFCKALDQSNMVGGGNEVPRNEQQNILRLERIKQLVPNPLVLDYGCGNGMLVEYLGLHDVQCLGYDAFNSKFNILENRNYNIVTMVEVIEHLSEPFSELDEIYHNLEHSGIVYIETSFSDWLSLNDSYIEPKVGHCTVWSHAGLTAMMLSKGFIEGNHIDRNVRIYIKP